MNKASIIKPVVNTNTKNLSKFLSYIHNFRGFAILMVVAHHIIAFLQWDDKVIADINQILIGNGTICFVFIGGFLFQFLSSTYEYKKYLLKKLQHVLLPYLFISIPAVILSIKGNCASPNWFSDCFLNLSTPGQILTYLLTGSHLAPFWFIPMITIFYITSPLLLWVDTHPKMYQPILPILLTITVVVSRPAHNDNTIQSFVHFLSVYIVGMFCSHFRENLFLIMQKKYLLLLVSFVILTILEVVITPRPTAINSLSKLILSVLVIYFLWLFELRLPKRFHDIMGLVAELSFGIYFFHAYFIIVYIGAADKFGFDPFWTQANLLTFSLIFFFVVGASIVSLLLIKRILGKKSRFFVGF